MLRVRRVKAGNQCDWRIVTAPTLFIDDAFDEARPTTLEEFRRASGRPSTSPRSRDSGRGGSA